MSSISDCNVSDFEQQKGLASKTSEGQSKKKRSATRYSSKHPLSKLGNCQTSKPKELERLKK
jgi:hypothetical protein